MDLTFFILLGLLLASSILGYQYFKLGRFLSSIPKAKIRSAPQGYAEFTGKAQPNIGIPMYAPGTSTKCVWYEAEYLEPVGSEYKNVTKRSTASFLLDDGTGVCRIDPFLIKIETRSSINNLIRKFFPRSGLLSVRWIAVGEEVHAYGQFETLYSDYASQKKDMVREKVTRLKKDRSMLMDYDTNQDGAIDSAEWGDALDDINTTVDKHILDDQKKRRDSPQIHALREPENKSYPFLVSTRNEMALIKRYRYYAIGFVIIFVIALIGIINPHFITDFTASGFEFL